MKIIQIGIDDSKITEILSKLGVFSAICEVGPKTETLNEKYPLKIYEIVSVFCETVPKYYPQFFQSKPMNTNYNGGGNGVDDVVCCPFGRSSVCPSIYPSVCPCVGS